MTFWHGGLRGSYCRGCRLCRRRLVRLCYLLLWLCRYLRVELRTMHFAQYLRKFRIVVPRDEVLRLHIRHVRYAPPTVPAIIHRMRDAISYSRMQPDWLITSFAVAFSADRVPQTALSRAIHSVTTWPAHSLTEKARSSASPLAASKAPSSTPTSSALPR